MSRITINVCKLITDMISKYNWYFRVIRKWNKIFNEKWAVQMRYSKRKRKKKRGKKKEKEKKKEKYEEKRGKRDWYIISNGGLPGVKFIKDTSKEQFLLYLAKMYYVD